MKSWKLRLGGIAGIVILVILLSVFLIAAYIGVFTAQFVSAVVTSMLVLVTGVSVILTLLLLEENRVSRVKEVEPVLSVYLVPASIGSYNPVVKNIGNGPARKVKLEIELLPQNIIWEAEIQNIPKKEKVPVAPPSNEDITFNDDTFHQFDEIILRGECIDVFSNEILINDSFKFSIFENRPEGRLPYDNPKERSLKDIERHLKKIERRLK